MSATELAGAIRTGARTAGEVVEAHIAVHEAWNGRTGALVAERFAAARAEAAAVDERLAHRGASAAQPLLGVPFTVKESIAVAGMPHTAGLVARAGRLATETAPSVQRLLDAGAILLGVTNTSELTLWIESDNRLYGRTSTPYDPARTAGGSSGGEGAAVGCGGSPFGLGSDIAGSIRIPALFCGVFAHKPTSGVVPNTGSYPPSDGAAGRLLQSGPIARRAIDLMPLLRVLAGTDGRDGNVRDVTLGDPASVPLAGLRVLITAATSWRCPSRAIGEARDRAAGALAALGARPERVRLPRWRTAILPYLAELSAGSSGPSTPDLISAEGAAVPRLRELALHRGGPHARYTRLALMAERLGGDSAPDERLLARARGLADELTELLDGGAVLLHPAHPRVAPRHGTTLGRLWLLTPTAIFNLAGLPVTEVPLGFDERGLPVGVQVVAGRDRDHVAVAVALALEQAFGGWVAPEAVARRTVRR